MSTEYSGINYSYLWKIYLLSMQCKWRQKHWKMTVTSLNMTANFSVPKYVKISNWSVENAIDFTCIPICGNYYDMGALKQQRTWGNNVVWWAEDDLRWGYQREPRLCKWRIASPWDFSRTAEHVPGRSGQVLQDDFMCGLSFTWGRVGEKGQTLTSCVCVGARGAEVQLLHSASWRGLCSWQLVFIFLSQ